MRLSRYLEPELVLTDLDTSGVEDTLSALIDHLVGTGHVTDRERVLGAVLERERSHTTSLGNGVALPHATVSGVESSVLLVATTREGIPFGPADAPNGGSLDRLFFLLLSPLDAAGTHIKVLARIVRLVRSEQFVRRLVAAGSGPALLEEIQREDALHV